MLPLPAWWAIFRGPTCPTKVRHLLADHLEYVRRTGGPPRGPPEDEPGEAALPPDDEGVEIGELAPAAQIELLADAAVALAEDWQAQVLESSPRTFALGLCFVADRGAFLLEGVDPGLAARFSVLRDRLVAHAQGGGPHLSGTELGTAVDELEGLIPAVHERGQELAAGLVPPGFGPA